MPFVRFSRDKRGYEHTYLVHESASRGRPARARVLYWFRTPPGIKVGREPFDEAARRQIEEKNPGLTFDWNAIASTPIPPVPEVEHWRERRRLERAAKVARREEELEAQRSEVPPALGAAADLAGPEPPDLVDEETRDGEHAANAEVAAATEAAGAGDGAGRKRRRRRSGRKRRPGGDPAPVDSAETEVEEGEVSDPGSSDLLHLLPEPDATPQIESVTVTPLAEAAAAPPPLSEAQPDREALTPEE